MPPKPKFTREEIIEAALGIVSEKGCEALTARELGAALGSSARPIFTMFANMEELQQEVEKAAMLRFDGYDRNVNEDMPVFKQAGMKMISFAAHEPKLYQLLFMREDSEKLTFDDVFSKLGATADMCIAAIEQDYDMTKKDAETIFRNVWMYTFGVGALCATRVNNFTIDEVSEMLTTEFTAMMLLVKSGRLK